MTIWYTWVKAAILYAMAIVLFVFPACQHLFQNRNFKKIFFLFLKVKLFNLIHYVKCQYDIRFLVILSLSPEFNIWWSLTWHITFKLRFPKQKSRNMKIINNCFQKYFFQTVLVKQTIKLAWPYHYQQSSVKQWGESEERFVNSARVSGTMSAITWSHLRIFALWKERLRKFIC